MKGLDSAWVRAQLVLHYGYAVNDSKRNFELSAQVPGEIAGGHAPLLLLAARLRLTRERRNYGRAVEYMVVLHRPGGRVESATTTTTPRPS